MIINYKGYRYEPIVEFEGRHGKAVLMYAHASIGRFGQLQGEFCFWLPKSKLALIN